MSKRKKDVNNIVYSDTVYRSLLADYAPPELSEKKQENLKKRMAQISIEKSGKPSVFKIVSIAAMILLVPLSILIIADHAIPLSSPVQVISPQNHRRDQLISRQGSLITEPDESLVIQNDSEKILLYPETELLLKAGLLPRIKDSQTIIYRLKRGTLEIDRKNPPGTEDITIETDLGLISLNRGEFKVTVGEHKVVLICFAGQLNYISSDRNKTIILPENQILEVHTDESGPVYTRPEILSPDQIRKEKADIPEFRQIVPEKNPLIEERSELDENKPEVEHLNIQSIPNPEKAPAEQPLLPVQWERKSDFGSSSLVLTDHYLLLLGNDNTIKWLNLSDGSEAGTYQFDFKPENYQIFQDILYLYNNQVLTALNLTENKIIWQSAVSSMAYTTFAVDSLNIILPSADGNLYLLNREDGSPEKRIEADMGLYSKPVPIDGNIIFSTMSRKIFSVDRDSTEVNWMFETTNRLIGDEPVYIQEQDYIIYQDAENMLITLNISDGSEVFADSSLNMKRQDTLFLKNTLYILTEKYITAFNPAGDLLFQSSEGSPFFSIFRTEKDSPGVIGETGISLIAEGKPNREIYSGSIKLSAENSSSAVILTENNTLRLYAIKED